MATGEAAATARSERLAEQRRSLPLEPGVYLFRDAAGRVVYVGKAKALRKRVASHFSGAKSPMIDEVASIESVVVGSEVEALVAEQSFIKQYRPRFNVRLRDDKSYPFIGISMDEPFPRVYFTRERHRRDRVYFGPYPNAKQLRSTLELLSKVFQLRSCTGAQPGRRSGNPCLDYHLGRCGAPCVSYVSQDEYRRGVEQVIDFLAGRYGAIERELEERMRTAAAALEFETATRERNRLTAVRSMLERQRVANASIGTLDVIGIALAGADANAQIFLIRDGVLSDRQSFYLANDALRPGAEVLEEFLLSHYGGAATIPSLLIIGEALSPAVATALTERRGAAVELRAAERGEKRRMLKLAEHNAVLALEADRLRAERRRERRADSLEGLVRALDLDAVPVRIECFDVSNLQGTHGVASMTVFEGGAPKRSHYRRFRIRTVEGADDYASLAEVLSRRYAQWERHSDISPHDRSRDASFAALPGLVVIDGGKGQLAAGMRVLRGFVDQGVAVVALAKRFEEVYVPERKSPLILAPASPELELLQRIRDEAHRFAITHHRARRDRAMTASVLDELPGIGPARKRALIERFGSPEAVLAASAEALQSVPGLPPKIGRTLHQNLHRS